MFCSFFTIDRSMLELANWIRGNSAHNSRHYFQISSVMLGKWIKIVISLLNVRRILNNSLIPSNTNTLIINLRQAFIWLRAIIRKETEWIAISRFLT
jgi:hypothetical protein